MLQQGVILLCLAAVCYSLPVAETREKRSSHELSNQEEDLKRLADKSSKSSVSIAHHTSHVQHMNFENGATHIVDQSQDKVFDPMSGELLRRLEQTLRGEKSSPQEPLQEQLHTELEVPQQNIDESWNEEKTEPALEAQSEQEEQDEPASLQHEPETDQSEDSEPEVDQSASQSEEPGLDEDTRAKETTNEDWLRKYSPTQVAQYLVTSGDVGGFLDAIQDLVDSDSLSTEQAEEYESEVSQSYQRLIQSQMLSQYGESEESNVIEPEEESLPVAQEPEMVESAAEVNHAYVTMLQDTLQRLYTEAVLDGNRQSEKTLRDFVSYVTQMAGAGDLPEEEVAGIVSMLTTIMEDSAPPVMTDVTHPEVAEKVKVADKQIEEQKS